MGFVPGSIIKRRMTGVFGILFHHMGIYVNNDMVIHFTGEKKRGKAQNILICKDTLQTFTESCEIKLHTAPKNFYHAKAVCEEANRLLRDKNNRYNHQYSFVFNNCEDFCIACYEVQYY